MVESLLMTSLFVNIGFIWVHRDYLSLKFKVRKLKNDPIGSASVVVSEITKEVKCLDETDLFKFQMRVSGVQAILQDCKQKFNNARVKALQSNIAKKTK